MAGIPLLLLEVKRRVKECLEFRKGLKKTGEVLTDQWRRDEKDERAGGREGSNKVGNVGNGRSCRHHNYLNLFAGQPGACILICTFPVQCINSECSF